MFAERLSYLRSKKKKTQQEMADAIGVTRPAYTAYESGNRKPDYETLNKIVDTLNTNADFLLGRTDDASPKIDRHDDEEEIDKLLDDPVHGAFFKGYLDAPEQKKAEMRQFLKFILEQEKDRKPGQEQGD